MSRRRVWPALVVAGLVLVGAGVYRAAAHTTRPAAQPAPVTNIGRVPGLAASTTPRAPFTAGTPRDVHTSRAGLPAGSRLRIAALDVDADIARVRIHDHVMGVPHDPRVVGWWSQSSAPGEQSGTTVIVGHVNYSGVAGALGGLAHARPGEIVDVHEPGHDVRYRLAAIRTYRKSRGLPDDLFATRGAPRLVLITCGGPFDPQTGSYLDNVVGYAVPA